MGELFVTEFVKRALAAGYSFKLVLGDLEDPQGTLALVESVTRRDMYGGQQHGKVQALCIGRETPTQVMRSATTCGTSARRHKWAP